MPCVVHFLDMRSALGHRTEQQLLSDDVPKDYILFALALRNDTLDLIQPTIGAWRTVFDDVAANFPCTTALTRFGSSPLDALVRTRSPRFQAGIGCGAFGGVSFEIDGL